MTSPENGGSRRDVVWSALEAIGSGLFSISGAFVVARLIGPAELGIGAAAVATHVLLWVAVNALFADAMVQRPHLSPAMAAAAAWASTAFGCAAAVAQAGAGWALAWMVDDPRLVPMALVLAVPLPFVGLGGAMQGMMTRRRRYGVLAARTLTGQGVGMVLGVSLALVSPSAWAPVAQQAAASLISAFVLTCASGWWPEPAWRWTDIRALLRVGMPLTASTLVQIGRYRVFALLIGGTAGPEALGQIHVAFRLADTSREILFSALWRLFLPILSAHQTDRAALLSQVDRLLRISSVATLGMCGGLAVTVVPVTALVLGPAWRGAGVAAEPLIALTALLALMFPSGVALIAMGQARLTLYANFAGLAATVGFVLGLRPESPWRAVLVWCGAQVFVSPYSLWVNGQALGTGPFRPLRAGLPMLAAAGMGVAMAIWISDGEDPSALIWRAGGFILGMSAGALPIIWEKPWRQGTGI